MAFDYSVNFTAIDSISAKIDKINAKIAGLKQKASQASKKLNFVGKVKLKTKEAFAKIKRLEDKIKGIAQKAIIIGGVGLFGVKKALDKSKVFQASFAGVAKVANLSKEKTRQLREEILKASKTMPINPKGIAEIYEAGAKLNRTGKELSGFVKTAGTVAIALDIPDVGEVAGIMGKMGSLLKYDNKAFVKFGDILNYTADHTATDAEKLINVIGRLSAKFGDLEFEQSDVVGVGAFAEMVTQSKEVAGSGMKRVLTKLQSVDKYRKQLEKSKGAGLLHIFESVAKMSKVEQMKWLDDYIAKSGEARTMGQQLINNTKLLKNTLAVSHSSKAIGSLQKEYEVVMKLTKTKEELASNAYAVAMIRAGETIRPVYDKILEVFTKITTSLGAFIKENPKLSKAIGITVAILSTLAVVAGTVALAMFAISATVMVWVGAITLVVGALVGLYVYWDSIVKLVTPFSNLVIQGFKNMGERIMYGIQLLGEWWNSWSVGSVIEDAKTLISDFFMKVGEWSGAFDFMGGVAEKVQSLAQPVQYIIDLISSLISKLNIIDNVKAKMAGIGDSISGAYNSAVNYMFSDDKKDVARDKSNSLNETNINKNRSMQSVDIMVRAEEGTSAVAHHKENGSTRKLRTARNGTEKGGH